MTRAAGSTPTASEHAKPLKVVLVVGARPNYMKAAPLYNVLRCSPGFEPMLVHTGQHYDAQMSKVFFDDLQMPKPDVYLGVGSGSQAVQTANVMIGFEKVLLDHSPDWVVVFGDVNSTIACALDAVKMGIKVAHVEAGLRSRDHSMPEEINRILTDSISDILFTPSPDANKNLLGEGVPPAKIEFVGNIMIDTLRQYESVAAQSNILKKISVLPKGYGLVTLHRPSNVDNPAQLSEILDALDAVQKKLPLVFPMHPRSRKMIAEHNLEQRVNGMRNLKIEEPIGYLDFLKLQKNALLVLTDSGGIQEETTALGVPCLTIRENTERPITVEEGTNVLVGLDKTRIVDECERILRGESKTGRIPALWDGHTAERIVEVFSRGTNLADSNGRKAV